MKYRIGVLLCGCGAYDGTDPQEAILTLLEIQSAGHEMVVLAMDEPLLHVADHTTAQGIENETRNQFLESARISRNKLYKLDDISPKVLDGLIIPGGQGVPKNLTHSFGETHELRVKESVGTFLEALHEKGGVIGAVSLAEFVLTTLFGPFPEGKGCFDIRGDEVLENPEMRLYLTPGQTIARDLPELHRGIQALVQAVVGRIGRERE